MPAANAFGNAAVYYGDMRNPPVFIENLGIVKHNQITERVDAEIRADISNLFNRTLFGTSTPISPSPTTSAGLPAS